MPTKSNQRNFYHFYRLQDLACLCRVWVMKKTKNKPAQADLPGTSKRSLGIGNITVTISMTPLMHEALERMSQETHNGLVAVSTLARVRLAEGLAKALFPFDKEKEIECYGELMSGKEAE
jgi:hypothetical protein